MENHHLRMMSHYSWTSMYITSITVDLRPPWAIKAQFSTRPNWASKTMVFLCVYFFLTDAQKRRSSYAGKALCSSRNTIRQLRKDCYLRPMNGLANRIYNLNRDFPLRHRTLLTTRLTRGFLYTKNSHRRDTSVSAACASLYLCD